DKSMAAGKGYLWLMGVGRDEFFSATNATPIIEYTNEVIYVNDYEIAVIKDGVLDIQTKEAIHTTPYIQKLEMKLDAIEKGGYEHFMLKEIFEQPRSIMDSMRG